MALPTLPTSMPAGHVPTAPEYQAMLDYMNAITPTVKIKAADQSVSNSTTLVNDSDLFFTPAINSTWTVICKVSYEGGTIGDIKYCWLFPAGASFSWGQTVMNTGSTWDTSSSAAFLRPTSGSTFNAGSNNAGNRLHSLIFGTLIMSSTAGNLQFQFAQNALDAGTPTKVNQDSFLMAFRTA